MTLGKPLDLFALLLFHLWNEANGDSTASLRTVTGLGEVMCPWEVHGAHGSSAQSGVVINKIILFTTLAYSIYIFSQVRKRLVPG